MDVYINLIYNINLLKMLNFFYYLLKSSFNIKNFQELNIFSKCKQIN